MKKKTIVCIGAGYVGGPTMAVIAKKCPDYEVIVVDVNKERIDAWQSDNLPIFEPGLCDVVKSARGRNLFFSNDVRGNIDKADIIFVSVNTPTKTFGEGAGMAANLEFWEKTAREILQYSTKDKIVVEKSTLPVKTAQAMEQILNSGKTGVKFEVVSNPEFLAEGSAVKDLENPERVLIGGHETEAGRKAIDEIAAIYRHWVPEEKIIKTNLWSSELSKLTANAFLAQRISSINSISAFCEITGASVTEVSRAISMDSRIGSKFLNASVGFGGSCFKKDILNLVYLCQHFGLIEVADYWHQVVLINDYQKKRFVRRMIAAMFNTVAGKKIAILGFAFKANTGDTRESPAIDICRYLFEERAELIVSDPEALNNAKKDLMFAEGKIMFVKDPYEACKGADAIAVLTEWDEYKKLDYGRIYDSMNKPSFVFDGRNILDHKMLFSLGFNVYPLGKENLSHLK